jgi:uncharacterized protein YukE
MYPTQEYVLEEQIKLMRKRIDELSAQIDGAYQDGLRYIDELAETVGEAIASTLRNALTRAKNEIDAQITKLKKMLDQYEKVMNVPNVLLEMAPKWLLIRDQANAVAVAIAGPDQRMQRNWNGPAASAYYGVVPGQVAAASRVAAVAEKANASLNDMATAGKTFNTALAAAQVEIALGLVGVVAAMKKGSIAGLIAAGAALLKGEQGIKTALEILLLAEQKAGPLIEGEVTNPVGFATGPTWPKAAASISHHVTAADGNPAEWIPKR